MARKKSADKEYMNEEIQLTDVTEEDAGEEDAQGRAGRKPRREYSEQEAEAWKAAGATRGRKGCKAIRINMAFEPDVHEFIRTMANVRGETVTSFTNHIFHQYMKEEEVQRIYQKALEFRASL